MSVLNQNTDAREKVHHKIFMGIVRKINTSWDILIWFYACCAFRKKFQIQTNSIPLRMPLAEDMFMKEHNFND